MHKAAIDNNTYLLTYLRDVGKLKIDDEDYDGNTPLHFACGFGSEEATFWLLGFGADPNVQNGQGDTPLHVLLKSKKLLNTKNIRELVFKGANREKKNNEGLTPLDLVKDIEFEERMEKKFVEDLKSELIMILGPQPTYLPCFHIKQPFIKLEQSKKTMFTFLSLTFFSQYMLHTVVMPFDGPREYAIQLIAMFLVAIMFFFATACKNPGTVKKSKKISFLKLNQYFHPSYICPTCEILRPVESRHCYICNKCVDRFDHHCQWVNQCIGMGNHNVFYLFLISIWTYLIYLNYVCFMNLDLVIDEELIDDAVYTRSGPLKRFFLPAHLSPKNAQYCYNIVILCVITLASFFLLPVTVLVVAHTKNVLSNKTTHNRIKMIQELDSKDYAQRALLPDNLHLFRNKEAASGFAQEMGDRYKIDAKMSFVDSGDEDDKLSLNSGYS